MFRIRPQFTFRPPLQTLRNHIPYSAYKQQSFNRGPQYKRFVAGGLSGLFFRWAARPTFYRDVGLITTGTGGVYVYNLENVPVSGRRRFNIITPGLEERLGRATVDEVKQQYAGKFLDDADPRVRLVKKVLERLLPFAEGEGLKGLDWEIHVIDSPEQNAFVVPGGKVFVFTGILPLCQGEDGIAAVLGHEIAHIVAHHTAYVASRSLLHFASGTDISRSERLSTGFIVPLAALIFTLFFDTSFQLGHTLLNILLSMPASRKHEAEADYIGLMMMAQGCYRPEAAMEFWNRMEKLGQGGPEILSTHPSNHNREEKIREWLPKAMEKAEKSDCHITAQYGTLHQDSTYWHFD
jgi:Zn-dependent protease with chaperone function